MEQAQKYYQSTAQQPFHKPYDSPTTDLRALFSQYVNQHLSFQLSPYMPPQTLTPLLESLLKNFAGQFLCQIETQIQRVKCQNTSLKLLMQQQLQEFESKLGAMSGRIRSEYQSWVLSENERMRAIFKELQQVLKQSDIILAVRNLSNENRMLKESLGYRQVFIQQLHCEIKLAKVQEAKLIQEIHRIKHKNEAEQEEFRGKTKDLQLKVIQEAELLRVFKIELEDTKRKSQEIRLNWEKDKTEKEELEAKFKQLKQQTSVLTEQADQLMEQKGQMSKRIELLKEQNEYLRNKIDLFRIKASKIDQKHQKINFQIFAKTNIICSLQQTLLHSSESNSKQVSSYQKIMDEHNIKFAQQVKDLREQNQKLQEQCLSCLAKSQQNENLAIFVKQRFEKEIVRMKEQFENEIRIVKEDATKSLKENDKKHMEEIGTAKEKFQVMQKTMEELKMQIGIKEEKDIEYQKCLQEIIHLKKELENKKHPNKKFTGVINNPQFGNIVPLDFENTYYKTTKILKGYIEGLKVDLKGLRVALSNQNKTIMIIIQKVVSQIFVKVWDHKNFCEYCQHKQQIQRERPIINKGDVNKCQTAFKDKETRIQSLAYGLKSNSGIKPCLTTSKKHLYRSVRDLAKRYEQIQQQNRYFANHIETFLKK